MVGANHRDVIGGVAVGNGPLALFGIEMATGNLLTHLECTAQFLIFLGTRLPHHARPLAGIAERIDQRLDDLALAAALLFGPQRVPHRGRK